jgi:outer membrane immunogenic protein
VTQASGKYVKLFPVSRAGRASQSALLSVSIYAVVAGSPALAQPVNWTGFYAGLYAGGVWGRGKSTATSDCPASTGTTGGYYCDSTVAGTGANASAVTSAATGSNSSSSFAGGIQGGYNWQTGSTVYGIEADLGAFRIKGARSASGVFPVSGGANQVNAGDTFTVTSSFDTTWLLTARGRVGWAASQWLIYATGGLAVSRVNVGQTYSDNYNNAGFFGAGSASTSTTKVGWTLGAGLEYALTKNWSIKGEYLFVDLGSVSSLMAISNAGGVGYTNAIRISTDLTAHIARLGANYRF